MNEITVTNAQLPDTIEDLSKFVLVNEERITALKAQIRAIKKVNLAKEVYEQKLAEAQEIGEITVEAAQKMGELLLQIQKHQGNSSRHDEELKTKTEITSEMGMTKDQVSQYQQMAQNPEAVQAAIQKAIDNGDVVSRAQVMKEIRAIKEQLAERDRTIESLQNRPPQIKEVVPHDYQELKKKAGQTRAVEQDYRNEQRKVAEKQKEILKLQDEIKELQEKTAGGNLHERVMEGALYFIAGCGGFVRDYGGYIFITDHLDELDEQDRKNYRWAIENVYAWAQKFLEALERGEQKLIGGETDE